MLFVDVVTKKCEVSFETTERARLGELQWLTFCDVLPTSTWMFVHDQ